MNQHNWMRYEYYKRVTEDSNNLEIVRSECECQGKQLLLLPCFTVVVGNEMWWELRFSQPTSSPFPLQELNSQGFPTSPETLVLVVLPFHSILQTGWPQAFAIKKCIVFEFAPLCALWTETFNSRDRGELWKTKAESVTMAICYVSCIWERTKGTLPPGIWLSSPLTMTSVWNTLLSSSLCQAKFPVFVIGWENMDHYSAARISALLPPIKHTHNWCASREPTTTILAVISENRVIPVYASQPSSSMIYKSNFVASNMDCCPSKHTRGLPCYKKPQQFSW